MKKNKKTIVFMIFKILITILLLISFSLFTYNLLKLNIIPDKYIIIGFIIILIILILLLLFLYKIKNIIFKIMCIILIFLFSTGFILGTNYISSTYTFIDNTNNNYDTLTYSVIVLNKSNYNNIEDLKDRKILYLEDNYKENIKNELNGKINFDELTENEFGTIIDKLLKKEVDAIVLEESYIAIAKDELKNFSSDAKVIYSFELQEKSHVENPDNDQNKITLEPFILYISGIDQWGNVNSVRGRSDVNMLAVVNPLTNHILLVNTPRDYYVQLAGTTGYKDKLTHAGIYGIEKSIKTLEDLYDIDITHYLRVNFNTVIKVVDIIGGIDIYSDKAFTCYTNTKVHVKEGLNHFGGKEALAYARERYAYTTGDHHRGENQQQVIKAIFEKVTTSTILISKYNTILNSLNGSFQTDMSMNEITSFIKHQLDKMPNWTIDTTAVTGTGAMDYTHSMGSKLKLYVMKPDENSIEKAKEKINEVLDEK